MNSSISDDKGIKMDQIGEVTCESLDQKIASMIFEKNLSDINSINSKWGYDSFSGSLYVLKPTFDEEVLSQRQAVIEELLGSQEIIDYFDYFNSLSPKNPNFNIADIEMPPQYKGENSFIESCLEVLSSFKKTPEFKLCNSSLQNKELFDNAEVRLKPEKSIIFYTDPSEAQIFLELDSKFIESVGSRIRDYRINGLSDIPYIFADLYLMEKKEYVIRVVSKAINIMMPYVKAAETLKILSRSRELPLSKVKFKNDKRLEIKNAYTLDKKCVPIDIFLEKEVQGAFLIAANSYGKTYFGKTLSSQLDFMLRTGYVFADSASIGKIPRALYSIQDFPETVKWTNENKGGFYNLVDNLFDKISKSPKRTIMILDETFAGTTNLHDLEYFYNRVADICKKKDMYILFTTHDYSRLSSLPSSFQKISFGSDHKPNYEGIIFDNKGRQIINELMEKYFPSIEPVHV